MAAVSPRYAGTKSLAVRADNEARGLPTIGGFFVFFDAATGATLATMDAAELTARRTAAVSALASRQLSRPDASRLLVIGAGKLVPHLAEAHAAVRPRSEEPTSELQSLMRLSYAGFRLKKKI